MLPLRRDVRALAGVAVPPVRSPASGDPVPGFDTTESLSQTQVTLSHCSLTSTAACTVYIYIHMTKLNQTKQDVTLNFYLTAYWH